ncbi:MAG: LysR family transcriptional regulator [Steroidobacteraceae bacterium]|nr:LysR family transcriptional regulator [Steroidobacteraceae bacterium]
MLDEIRTFVLLAEEGAIHRVAARVRLTQPAVSRQIQRLEQALGVELLDRRQKPPRLTPSGVEALAHCRQILAAYADMRRIRVRGEPEGCLRVGIAHGLADERLAVVIRGLREAYPKVVLRLTAGWSDELAETFQQGKLDVICVLSAFRTTRSRGENAALAREPLAVISSSEFARALNVTRAGVARAPWILSPEPCDARRLLARALSSHSRQLNVVAEVQDAGLQVALVREGLGLSLLPLRRFRADPPEGVVALDVRGLHLALHVEFRRSPHLHNLEQVAEALSTRFTELLG